MRGPGGGSMSGPGEPGDCPPTSRSPVAGQGDPIAVTEDRVNAIYLAFGAGNPAPERQLFLEVSECLRGILERCRMSDTVRTELARAEALAGTAVAVLDATRVNSAALLRGVVRRT